MPRISAAARASAQWRDSHGVNVPRNLSGPALDLWETIVADRPADYFRPGTLHLLATFCKLSVEVDALLRQPRKSLRESTAALAVTLKLSQLAEKLALTPSVTMGRKSGARDEPGATMDPLLGGQATRGPGAKR